jgi:hypothetical protein
MKVLVAGFALWWATLASGPAFADRSCDRLWHDRNAIYKEAGYCFRTARGIRTFGNAGCSFDDVNEVPLSANQRQIIAIINSEERALRCPR